MIRRILLTAVLLLCLHLSGLSSSAATAEDDAPAGPFNVPTPTLGGTQFWTDQLLFHDWRIQQSSLTGHYRLLDGRNIRRAWGDFDHCRAMLEAVKREQELPPMRGKAVILLHGLCSVRYTMNSLGAYLREDGDYTVLNMTYASTRRTLDDHAAALDSVIRNLDGIEKIDFVGHSLGNIVVRRYLAMQTDDATGATPDPRIRRFVMLGPPNNGSNLAARFDGSLLVSFVGGDPLKNLGDEWSEFADQLATPECEFGIIAGDLSGLALDNLLIPGGDDLIVGVEETRLPGARDFLTLPVAHLLMERDKKLQEHTLRFLEHGYFRTADTREPVLAPIVKPAREP
jgi:pimeloyl-ACP methyl ester carboxylesterase